MTKIKACLFDMDGLLIDSERIYTETTIQLLLNHGRPGVFPMSVKSRMMGLPGPQAAALFLDWAGLGPGELTVEGYMAEQRALQSAKFPLVNLMPGALALVRSLADGAVAIGLATSSTRSNLALKRTNLESLFSLFGDNIVCGDDACVVGRGKPRPDIFLASLAQVNQDREVAIQPDECLVLEDGVPGVTAGLAAGMHVLWVPDREILEIHKHEVQSILGTKGVLIHSLEDFPYERYGISRPC